MAAGDTIHKLRLFAGELLPRLHHHESCARVARETEGAPCDCGLSVLWDRAKKLGVTRPTRG